MKKTLKTVLAAAAVLIVIGLCIGGYFIWRHNTLYIGKDAALSIALEDAGLSTAELIDKDTDFEKTGAGAYYDVDFESFDTEYEYTINAVTGEILYSSSEPR